MRKLIPALSIGLIASTMFLGSRSHGVARAAASPIQHVVIVDQENHSFDDLLGAFCTEQAAGTLVRAGLNQGCDGAAIAKLSKGTTYQLTTEPDFGLNIDHSVNGQATAIDKGKMDGFDQIKGCRSTSKPAYGCLTQFDALRGTCGAGSNQTCIPNAVDLAKHFAISDRTFEFRQTPSWAGHMILGSATLQDFVGDNPKKTPSGQKPGPGWGCDSGKLESWLQRNGNQGNGPKATFVPACVPDARGSMGPLWDGTSYARAKHASYVPTIFDRLDGAHLPWRIYGSTGADGPSGYGWTICPTFYECLGSSQKNDLVPADSILNDAQSGHLPAVSFVTPTSANSEHQPASVSAGDTWVGSVVDAVMSGPDWNSTAIFLTWDDCGCFYDHVNPLQYNPEWGVRVPMIIISPYARAGYTDSQGATFVSLLAFVEHTFGLAPLHPCATVGAGDRNCTDDANAYDYSNAFDFGQSPLAGISMVRTAQPPGERAWVSAHPDAGDEDT
jgi:phospholipase C